MKSKTQLFIELWQEARTRFSNQLPQLVADNLLKKIPPAENSVGFLIRHIGEVELLFAKNVFGAKDINVVAKTIIAQRDTREWTDLVALIAYVEQSFETLGSIIAQQTDADWETLITTKEFGTKTKAQAFGRIVSHTTYHAGQMAAIIKYPT